MAKDPAVLFYTSDFLSGTYTLTDEQVGKYIRLLCLQHQKGKLTDKDMYRVCGTYDSEIFCKFIKEDELTVEKVIQKVDEIIEILLKIQRMMNHMIRHMMNHMLNIWKLKL